MYERSTNVRRARHNQAIYPPATTSNPQGVGAFGKRSGRCPEASNSSRDVVPLETSTATRGRELSGRQAPEDRSRPSQIGARESAAERGIGPSDAGVDITQKKDELGLAHRRKGATYSPEQRLLIIEAVKRLRQQGIGTSTALKMLGICRSTYYSWSPVQKSSARPASAQRLTVTERESILQHKRQLPHLSHRKISGYLRSENIWVSASNCYRLLKGLNWVLPQRPREAPWEQAHYEPFRPNQIWGEDWTQLCIAGTRYYLLTLIDYFSRYIVAWRIVKTVTHQEVRHLLMLAYLTQNIDTRHGRPLIRMDRGSPNRAHSIRRLIKDLEMVLSPSRAHRPTDNGRQKCWYRTVKQEEIYYYPEYPPQDSARSSLVNYINEYNEERPHQA
jgi:putative transposase